MKIYPFFSDSMASNTYIVTDDAGDTAVVIDPSQPYRALVGKLPSVPRFTAILLTHAHFDHILSLDEWRTETHAPVYIGCGDAAALVSPRLNLYAMFYGNSPVVLPAEHTLKNGDTLPLGEECFSVFETPGHTQGSLVYRIGDTLFTGDTLFADGGYGRTDFPGGDAAALLHSIRKIFLLRDNLTLYAGHGPATTLEKEAAMHGFML